MFPAAGSVLDVRCRLAERLGAGGMHLKPRVGIIAAAAVAAGLILLLAAVAHAGQKAWWDSTEFQVVNLDSAPAAFAARFIDIAGTEVYSFTDTIPPGGTRFYAPGEMDPPLDPLFSGTLALDSAQSIAATVLHRDAAPLPLFDGNTTFDVVADPEGTLDGAAVRSAEVVSPTQFPADRCTSVAIQNPGMAANVATVSVYDSQGVLIGQRANAVAPGGAVTVSLSELSPVLLYGGAVIDSDEPVRVAVVRSCPGAVGAGAYTPLPAAGARWLVPQFFPASLGFGRVSYLNLKNASSTQTVAVTVECP